jgi:nucleoside 2-deoxyribosyltransferase
MEFLVYLAGPIKGLGYTDSNSWREYVIDKLPPHIHGVNPLRYKSYLKDEQHIKDSYNDHVFSTGRGITARDLHDVKRCDAVLANFLGTKTVSIGTCMEIGAATILGKPIIGVMEHEGQIPPLSEDVAAGPELNAHYHAMIREAVEYWVCSLDEGIEVVSAIVNPNCRFAVTC